MIKIFLAKDFHHWESECQKKEIFREKFLRLWKKEKYDVLIMPNTPCPAGIIGKTQEILG